MHDYGVLPRCSPVPTTRHEEFMQRKLTVKIFANFLDTLRVSCLSEVGVKATLIAIQQVLASTQVLPCSGPHRRWNTFTTALFHLYEEHTQHSAVSLWSMIKWYVLTSHSTLYRSLQKWSLRPLTWLVQKTSLGQIKLQIHYNKET